MDRHHPRRDEAPPFTVDWIDRFGLDAFVPKKPYYDIKPREKPDYESIEKAARLYAETKELASKNVDTKSAIEKFQLELQKQHFEARQAQAEMIKALWYVAPGTRE